MSMYLQIAPQESYLYAAVSGDLAFPEAEQLTLQIFDACLEHQVSKVLVDVRPLQGTLSTMQSFGYGTFLADTYKSYRLRGLKVMKIAYVGNAPLIEPDSFAETVAVNRGLNAKATTSLAEAEGWLGVEAVARP